ncbi:MAG TPA: class I SAM-dependent methyltransferase [Chitinophagaceae bacterium]|nr:class I SAM-dependent methyltransferase [Chitinophagaceae bacterium]
MDINLKSHWNRIYEAKASQELTWAEEVPATSLEFIHSFELAKTARIIDVGGGDSKLVDHLLQEGYTNLNVLDISEQSLQRARQRLGDNAKRVTWINSDIREFRCDQPFDLWHDRAAFHFLTHEEDIMSYLNMVRHCVKGYMILGTFSATGPNKCSGLPVKQYSDLQLTEQFMEGFKKIRCVNVDHITPAKAVQNFTFCSFSRNAA